MIGIYLDSRSYSLVGLKDVYVTDMHLFGVIRSQSISINIVFHLGYIWIGTSYLESVSI